MDIIEIQSELFSCHSEALSLLNSTPPSIFTYPPPPGGQVRSATISGAGSNMGKLKRRFKRLIVFYF